MNDVAPSLLTLLHWAAELSGGRRCASWEAWCARAPDAATKWERIAQAQDLLATDAAASNGRNLIPAADLVAYVNGALKAAAALRMEERLWDSPEQLALALRELRIAINRPYAADRPQGAASTDRQLQPMQPYRVNGHGCTPRPRYRLAPAADRAPAQPLAPLVQPRVLGATPPTSADGNSFWDLAFWQWPAVATAALVAVCLSGAIAWLIIGRERMDATEIIAGQPIGTENSPECSPASPSEESEAAHHVPFAAPPQLAIQTAVGLALVQGSESNAWQAVRAQYSLEAPARVLSLAETWATVDIPGVARLILEGTTEVSISQTIHGVIEVRVERGHVGIEELGEAVELHVWTGPATWTVLGLSGDSVLAVMFDPQSPGIALTRGQIAIDNTAIETRQLLRWRQGVFSLAGAAPAAEALAADMPAPAVNPWSLEWLAPPEETRQLQWSSDYGELVERLTETNDLQSKLKRLLAATDDKRYLALLAHWAANLEPANSRAARLWHMLRDQRLAIRIAAVTCLLDLPPGDRGREDLISLLQDATDQATGSRVTEWLNATREAAPLSHDQALQLMECLTHEELAVRQIAVSLLELHTTAALLQAGQRSPAFDAAGPLASCQAGQQEWRSLLGQLFTASSDAGRLPEPTAAKLVQ